MANENVIMHNSTLNMQCDPAPIASLHLACTILQIMWTLASLTKPLAPCVPITEAFVRFDFCYSKVFDADPTAPRH
jgi:hypothetical protein